MGKTNVKLIIGIIILVIVTIVVGGTIYSVTKGKTENISDVGTEKTGKENDIKTGNNNKETVENSKQSGNNKKVKKECTYLNISPDSRYMIDMVEYPDWDSGQGKLEDLGNGLYLGVANYNNLTSLLCEEAVLEKVSDVTDIPTVMEEPIAMNFSEVLTPMRGRLGIYTFKELKYSKVENIGKINGYQMCRFEGKYVFEDEGSEIEYAVVGYTTFLKQSGYPIYVSTIDASEDQSNVKKLDKVAYDCIKTLQELTEEEVRKLGY